MSFYRVGYSGIATKKKKASVKKKPKWDDTNHDLSAYKATDEEIMQRKLAHKSKNHMAFKLQQMRKGEKKGSSNAPVGGQISQQQARQLAIMKEILYDQRQLKNVLDKTDNMMAVVQDLFGDDPKKYKGFPNITTAPNNIAAGDANRTSQLAPDMPEIYTRIEALSDSVMNPSALNDLPDSDSDEDGKSNPHPIVYQPQMNLQRFQQFIANEEKNQTLSSIGGQAQLSHNEVGPVQSTQIQGMSGFETPPKDGNESIGILRSPRSAINDTSKVKKSRNRVPSQSIDTTTQSSTMNLTDMRKVLESLEDEIEEFEKQTGRRPPAEKQRANTFSGYTVALIDAVSKLAKYLKETDRRLQAEITVREQLTQDVHQMRNIIDALTSDIIVTQEEYGKTQTQFERYRQKTEQEFAVIKAALHGMGVQTINVNNSSGVPPTTITPPKHHPDEQFSEMYQYLETFRNNNNLSTVQGPAITSLPSHTTTTQSLPNPALKSSLPDHLQDHGAVLLSPPVRKTRVHDQQEHNNYQDHSESLFSRRQTSLIDLPALANGVTTASDSYNMPPVGATINVPRPIPLSKPITSQTVETSQAQYQQVSIQAQDHLPAHVSVSVVRNPVLQGGMPKNPREDDMKSQIAELNKQHEEAQKRLQLLLVQQQQQKLLSDQDKNQQNRLHTQDPQDRSPLNHMSQSMLNQQRQLMQQQQQIAQLLERQSQSFVNQNNHNSHSSDRSELSQSQVLQQQENVMQHMQLQMERMQQQQQQGSMGFDIHRQMVADENTPPRDTNTQNGGPFSPAISPISQRSDNFYVPLQNQHPSRQAPRDIQISLPTVDFDSTVGDTPSPLKR
ncbi:hypothetical protein SNE40_011544 [Patella caerulea]|uniref:Spindle and centriole-associated protein 1 n=1 Tax=Patella caerulea TaxID=87958 RepID=A0AAN8PIP8_PATCE